MSENKEIKTCGECKYYVPYSICPCVGVNNITDYCERFEPKVITNGDKLRQMSDEELVEILVNPPCFICSREVSVACSDINCKETILATLKQEAKDE